jgi:uncharacterized repeat protein (TIGR03803 family)
MSLIPSGARFTGSSGYQVLYEFGRTRYDGIDPLGNLVYANGKFYGVTSSGGDSPSYFYGTIFSVTSTGTEAIVHDFDGTDGAYPMAGLTRAGRTLYGVTSGGGTNRDGVIFSIGLDGMNFRVLHDFLGSDGSYPVASLLAVRDRLYGTTRNGGASGDGTVFSIDADGSDFQTLYSFKAGSDGSYPQGALIDVRGTLFGTTASGGHFQSGGGAGTVFTISKSGNEDVIFTFDISDGEFPYAGLVAVNKRLYGTTLAGGPGNDGLIFVLNEDGSNERVLHAFSQDDPAGQHPETNLLALHGTFYGTTSEGGSGVGTIFSIDRRGGRVTVLHSFGNPPAQGEQPNALLPVNGAFYGTCGGGGDYGYGDGVFFTLPV